MPGIHFRIGMILLIMVTGTAGQSFAQKGPGSNMSRYVSGLPLEELDASERAGLVFMYEEEKLARDVYSALNEVWGDQVFSNIAASEQQHMASIEMLLVRYGVPVPDDSPGVYGEQALGELFSRLTDAGRESLASALWAGATIEDLDIADLKAHLAETDNKDIAVVYQNLMKGSRNHLRSFAARLSALGQPYAAQHLSAEEIRAILDHGRERGMLDEDGNPL